MVDSRYQNTAIAEVDKDVRPCNTRTEMYAGLAGQRDSPGGRPGELC